MNSPNETPVNYHQVVRSWYTDLDQIHRMLEYVRVRIRDGNLAAGVSPKPEGEYTVIFSSSAEEDIRDIMLSIRNTISEGYKLTQ